MYAKTLTLDTQDIPALNLGPPLPGSDPMLGQWLLSGTTSHLDHATWFFYEETWMFSTYEQYSVANSYSHSSQNKGFTTFSYYYDPDLRPITTSLANIN